MRLIDADALEELFREIIGKLFKEPTLTKDMEHLIRASAMVIEMIADASTVEVVGSATEYGECAMCGNRGYFARLNVDPNTGEIVEGSEVADNA